MAVCPSVMYPYPDWAWLSTEYRLDYQYCPKYGNSLLNQIDIFIDFGLVCGCEAVKIGHHNPNTKQAPSSMHGRQHQHQRQHQHKGP